MHLRERLDHFVLEIARVYLLEISFRNGHSVGISNLHMRTFHEAEKLARNVRGS